MNLAKEWDALMGCLVMVIVTGFLFVVAVLAVKFVWTFV
jgi:hypothetical protein